jgi:hypothetical protein
MREPVRFAVIGEGRDEHGSSAQGPMLRPLPEGSLWGGLVTLVARALRERCGRVALPVGWLPPVRDRRSQRPKAVELLADGNLLTCLLNSLLRPVRRSPGGSSAVDLVVLSVDKEKKTAFEKAFRQVPVELLDRVVPLVFEPEFEVLFTCCKKPLEDACGLPRCSTTPPDHQGDLKECLGKWLHHHAAGRQLDTRLRQDIARHLDLEAGSPLQEVLAFRELIAGLERWRIQESGKQKGRP